MSAETFFSGLWAKWLIKSRGQKIGLALVAGSFVWLFAGMTYAGTNFPGGGMPAEVHFWTWVVPQLVALGGLGLWAIGMTAVVARCRRTRR